MSQKQALQPRGSRSSAVFRRASVAKDRDARFVPRSFEDTQKLDTSRQKLLNDARMIAPMDLFHRLDKVPLTVIPKVVGMKLTWAIYLTFAAVALLARLGAMPHSEVYDDNALQGVPLLLAFCICFYVGHCYDRHYKQYFEAMACKGAIVTCCLQARAYCSNPKVVVTLWRYLNLAHVAGYCGLSPTYNKANLFEPFTLRHPLLVYAAERLRLETLDVDAGMEACHECLLWTLQTIEAARLAAG